MASDGRSNEREKEKEEFQEKFHKDEQKQKDEGQHWEKMVQANPKITEKSLKKSRSRKAESSTDEGDKKDNLART